MGSKRLSLCGFSVCSALDLRCLPQAPAAALQEQALSRDAEDARGFFDAAVRPFERVADEGLFERVDGGRQRLVEAQANLGFGGRVGGRERAPRGANLGRQAAPA